MHEELPPQELILVSLLAATDATWLPCREAHRGGQINPVVTNTYELRKQYRESGVSWSSGGTSDAERKEAQRALEDLTREGSVTVARPHGTKTLFAKLTDAAYDRTRQQCGLLGFDAGFLMLRIVALRSVRPATVYQHVFIPETKLNRDRGWGDGNQNELFRVSQLALPALVAGWLTTKCDCENHVYYQVTAAGWRLLDDGSKPADLPAIKTDSRFELAYYRDLHRERARLKTRTPIDDCELGWIALPVAHHNLRVDWSPA